ncbi:MAG: class I SAM-dependent methyltransferase [Candidatus Muiribacteriota bacterium]
MNFYESISEYYDDIFLDNKIKFEFLNSFLTNDDKSLLDVGCSTGAFSWLASKKLDVTGIDLDSRMIQLAHKKYPQIKFFKMNMLNIEKKFKHTPFDVIACFGNTLVHLKNSCCLSNFFAQVNKTLKPDKKFLFQILNYDRIFKENIKKLPLIENEKIKFEREYDFLKDKIINFKTRLTVKETGKIINNNQKLYGATSDEIIKFLNMTRFKNIQTYGSFKKDEFNLDSVAFIVVCEKNF